MPIHATCTQVRDKLARHLDHVTRDREIVLIRCRANEDAALIAASELSCLLETAYLRRSPANASRLLAALGRALPNKGRAIDVAALRREVGLVARAQET